MANYAPQSPTVTGVAPVPNPAAASDTYDISSGTKYMLRIKTVGTAANVTITDPTSVSPPGAQVFTPAPLIVMPATGERMVLIDANRFRDPTTGKLTLAFSATAAVVHELWAQQ